MPLYLDKIISTRGMCARMRGHNATVQITSRMVDVIPSGVYTLESVSTKRGKYGFSKLNVKNVHSKEMYSLDKEYQEYFLIVPAVEKKGTGAKLINLPEVEYKTAQDYQPTNLAGVKELPYSVSTAASSVDNLFSADKISEAKKRAFEQANPLNKNINDQNSNQTDLHPMLVKVLQENTNALNSFKQEYGKVTADVDALVKNMNQTKTMAAVTADKLAESEKKVDYLTRLVTKLAKDLNCGPDFFVNLQ